jgi:hypothetical protein
MTDERRRYLGRLRTLLTGERFVAYEICNFAERNRQALSRAREAEEGQRPGRLESPLRRYNHARVACARETTLETT